MVTVIYYIPYVLSIVLFIPVIINYMRLKRQRFIAVFSVLYLISTLIATVSLFYLELGNETVYALGELIMSIIDLLAGLALIINLHRIIYIRRIEVVSMLPIPLLYFLTNFVIGEPSIKALADEVAFTAELTSLIFLGASMTLYLGATYFGYQIYKERKGGSMYWLILSITMFIIFITQLSFFIIEISEELFLTGITLGIIRYLSLLTRGILTLIVVVILNILSWYYKTRILPLLEKIKTS